jgi:gamma-glutamyltranspeptidase/glutathione hydrolase
VNIPLSWLASPEYIHRLGDTIDPSHATPSRRLLAVDAGMPGTFPEPKHTSHISVVDKDGNAVALTTTINGYFGSCLVAKGTGILLNDEMDDFSSQTFAPNLFELVSGDANAIAPGKIALSSMAPTLVFATAQPEKVMLVLGAPGGSAIPTTVLQTISNVIDAGMDVQRAVGAGRVHHQFMPDAVMVDNYGLEPATERALEALGHPIQHRDAWSDAQVVYVDPETGLRYAASDPRFEGAALGQD